MVGYALGESDSRRKPPWLAALLSEKFFGSCSRHASAKKSERNIFCVDCSGSICPHCFTSHSGHSLVQVRRYVYHDVIRLHDIQKLVDCSQVQTYIINSARVVFLNQRPQLRATKSLNNCCTTCDRILQDSYRFCSIACKVDAAFRHGGESISLTPRSSPSPSRESKPEQLELEEEDEESSPVSGDDTGSQSSSGFSDVNGGCFDRSVTSVLMIPPPKRIRSNRCQAHRRHNSPRSVIDMHPSYVRRRKGTPHRSPIL